MTVRGFGEKTQSDYLRHVKNFTLFLGRSPYQAQPEDLRLYQVHQRKQGVQMPQHVRVHSEGEACSATRALDHPQEPGRCYWGCGLGHEDVRARPLQRSQGSKLRPMQGMNASAAALCAVHMQAPLPKIDLRPMKTAKLGSTEPMPVGQQDRTCIPGAIPPSLARSLDQPINLCLRQILPRAVRGVG
jgi:hypothetical protein